MSNSVKKKIIHTLLLNILTSTEFCILIVSERSGRPIDENNYFVFSMDVSLSAINEIQKLLFKVLPLKQSCNLNYQDNFWLYFKCKNVFRHRICIIN